ncbi:MAG: YggT family protein [Spirochaetales bacterium]|nr:YggT family protein [Spirochaetales bacterium]
MQTVLRILGAIISTYMLIIFIRIMLTWFRGLPQGRAIDVINRITDPYLNFFRKLTFLRTERVDFSPIAALLVLVIVLNIINTLQVYGKITLGIILSIILTALWSAVSFLLTFMLIMTVIRLFVHFTGGNTVSPLIHTLDIILNPLMTWLKRTFFKKRILGYGTALGFTGGALLVSVIVGKLLVNFLAALLLKLPF